MTNQKKKRVDGSAANLARMADLAMKRGGSFAPDQVWKGVNSKLSFFDSKGRQFAMSPRCLVQGHWSPHWRADRGDAKLSELSAILAAKGFSLVPGQAWRGKSQPLRCLDAQGAEFRLSPEGALCGRWPFRDRRANPDLGVFAKGPAISDGDAVRALAALDAGNARMRRRAFAWRLRFVEKLSFVAIAAKLSEGRAKPLSKQAAWRAVRVAEAAMRSVLAAGAVPAEAVPRAGRRWTPEPMTPEVLAALGAMDSGSERDRMLAAVHRMRHAGRATLVGIGSMLARLEGSEFSVSRANSRRLAASARVAEVMAEMGPG